MCGPVGVQDEEESVQRIFRRVPREQVGRLLAEARAVEEAAATEYKKMIQDNKLRNVKQQLQQERGDRMHNARIAISQQSNCQRCVGYTLGCTCCIFAFSLVIFVGGAVILGAITKNE